MPQSKYKSKAMDENRFRTWYKNISMVLEIDPNPDNPLHSYDYRGYYNKYIYKKEDDHVRETMQMKSRDPNVHIFTDEFKLPFHPTFSDESIYSEGKTKGGKWEGEKFIPSKWNLAAKQILNRGR